MADCYPAGETPAYHRPRQLVGCFSVGTRASRPRQLAGCFPAGGTPAYHLSRPRLVAKYLDEEFAQETFLELLLLRLEDVLLYVGVEEIALERAPSHVYPFGRQQGEVFPEDVLLE